MPAALIGVAKITALAITAKTIVCFSTKKPAPRQTQKIKVKIRK